MSDYGTVSGDFETLTAEQRYSLRNRVKEMLGGEKRERYTMWASYRVPDGGKPRSIRFVGQGYVSILILFPFVLSSLLLIIVLMIYNYFFNQLFSP